MMQIRKATLADLDVLIDLYEHARLFMSQNGNPDQWGLTYPSRNLLAKDIEEGHSYLCEENGEILIAFYYRVGIDDTYLKIYKGHWLSDAPYAAIHRIVSSHKKKGAIDFCLNWTFEQCPNLKMDTHKDNIIMQHVLDKNGFIYCGIIFTAEGDERLAYQKSGT
jgi:RimJ/RimL family protein N-acetyltransferase